MDAAGPDSERIGGEGAWPSRNGFLLALGVLLVSLGLVAAAWYFAREQELRAAESEFVARTGEVTELLRQQMVKYELVARGGASLFAPFTRPSPQQWTDYVDGMAIGMRFPGMVGLGFAGYVSNNRLDDLQLEWRDAGYGVLDVRPHGVRPDYGPILYLEPRNQPNIDAIGFDMYAEPVRNAAMRAALEQGTARLSGPVQLIQDGSTPRTSLLLYLPVYLGGGVPPLPSSRRLAMQGWVYVPFRLEPFIDSALAGAHADLRFTVSDISGAQARLLAHQGPVNEGGEAPAFRHGTTLDMYGRTWRIDFASAPMPSAASGVAELRNLLLLGICVALLVFALAWTLARTQQHATRIAARMTEEYRRSEQRFRGAMHYSAIGKALLDSEGRVVEANPALGRIAGRAPESMVGLRLDSLFEEETVEREPAERDRIDAEGVRRITRRLRHQHGAPRQAQLTYAPVPGGIGQDVAELVQVEDVTDRLRAEARVHALNRTLEARVALRTRELSHANQELESFAYSVSHDLRAPLRAIDGFSRVLVERYSGVLDDTGRDHLKRVRGGAARMGELIDAMLKMSRVGRAAIKPETVDLSRIAWEVLEELQAGESVRHVATRIAPGLHAHGDAALLHNLLGNLIGNAWKFTRGRDPTVIEFGATTREGGTVEYYVRDNGAGFAQEYVEKLFRPFQRLHTETEYTGHGIGLASVRRIVERHGGTIRAEGRVGEGATFWFTLPGAEAGD